MMFRSIQAADEESGSDWDDYTPDTTPAHKVGSTSRHARVSQHPTTHTSTNRSDPAYKTPTRSNASHPVESLHQQYKADTIVSEHTPSPRTLTPIETAIPAVSDTNATVSVSSPPPLTPAAINPVFKVTNETCESHSYPQDINERENETVRLLNASKSEVLEFAPISNETAGFLHSVHYPPPYSYMGGIAERSEKMSKRCTEEVFSCMRIISDFIITFTLGLIQYLLFHITRKLCCGAAHIFLDSIITPLINVCFNGLLWPLCSCVYQLMKALALVLHPVVDLVGFLLAHVTNMLRAFRLVEFQLNTKTHQAPLYV